MRELSECKAEVFRRSQAVIAARKKTRKKIVLCAVPLALCCVLGGWFLIEQGVPVAMDSSQEAAVDDFYFNRLEETPELSPTEVYVEVSGPKGETCRLTGEAAQAVVDILVRLEYDPRLVCRCPPEYKLQTSQGEFGVHLSQGYARCDAGQAKLTQQQLMILKEYLPQ